ncbi:Cysteine-rich repeat secretory protein 55 [Apostasia shenzhenica]|uniref:Cysteine-rich repeat secretory protein 55 n=1 Tax=Apostasia shenzhenica TaxID=1088818 RepID=A0A2I0A4V3_9ASPA|nr:Cysteine-rich repeat secretory protein 55 [Apostasia shenzhenica]
MASSIFLLFLPALLLPLASSAANTFEYYRCFEAFTGDDVALRANIKTVIASLQATVSQAGQAVSSAGAGTSDAVYGLAECWQGTSSADRSTYAAKTAEKLTGACGGVSSVGFYWYGPCFFRYMKGIEFWGSLSNSEANVLASSQFAPNPAAFSNWVNELLGQLKEKVAESGSLKFGSAKMTTNIEGIALNGEAQCTFDLTVDTCMDCLNWAFERIRTICSNRIGCKAFHSSCWAQFETN